MMVSLGSILVVVVLATVGTAGELHGAPDRPDSPGQTRGELRWMENRGQWSEPLRLVAWTEAGAVGVRRDALVVGLVDASRDRHAEVALVFEGASEDATAEGMREQPGRFHYFIGNDPSRWIRGVRTFESVLLRGLYAGIDVAVRDEGGRLEYDLHVAPGADLSQVVVRCEGMRGLLVEPDEVLLDTAAGELAQPAPRSWEERSDGSRRPLAVAYRRIDEHRFGFRAAGRDPELALVVDPELRWSTYWGGIGSNGQPDMVNDVVADEDGYVTVTGTVEGISSFPSESSFQSAVFGSIDAFVARLRRSDGELVYASRFGGSDADYGRGVAVSKDGGAVAVGEAGTRSEDFPTTPGALNTTKVPVRPAAYVLRLNSTGDDLVYSTFVQGANTSTANDVALSATGSAIVIGTASTSGFPVTQGAYAQTPLASSSGYVSRLDPTGSFLEWSTFFPANLEYAVVLDAQENVVFTGSGGGPNFPVTPGTFQRASTGGDAFATKLSSDGSQLLMSALFGGKLLDIGWGIAMTREGGVVVVGNTQSLEFPVTPGVFQESPSNPSTVGGSEDGFITVLDAAFSQARYSTYLGIFTAREIIKGVAVDGSGVVTVAGISGPGFPVTPGAFRVNGQQGEATITRLHPSGRSLLYSTLLGGPDQRDSGQGLSQGADGVVTVVGKAGFGFPTTEGAVFPNYIGGAADGFITTLALHPQGTLSFGASQPSCLGPVNMAALAPAFAGASFDVWCTQAPPSSQGFLLVRPAHASGEPLPGALSWLRPVKSDADGFAETSIGQLPAAPGLSFVCRYVFFDSQTCPGPAPVAWSNGLLVTVQ